MKNTIKQQNGDVNIGNRIRTFRENKHLTQKELADLVMISPSAITRLERGQSMVSVFTILDIAKVLDVPISSILTASQEFDTSLFSGIITKLQKCSLKQQLAFVQCCEFIIDVIFSDENS